MARKSWAIVALFIICGVVIIGRLFYLQIIKYDDFHLMVKDETTYNQTVNPERGIIYDADGNILAGNIPVYTCFISPAEIHDSDYPEYGEPKKYTYASYKDVGAEEAVARYLESVLDVPYSETKEKCKNEDSYYAEVKKEIDADFADEMKTSLKEAKLDHFIYLREESKRYYPSKTLAAHEVGFLTSDGTGRAGLEEYYNNLLEGTSGRYVGAKDARSREMDYKYTVAIEEKNGYNLKTTIKSYIQYELEKELAATLDENQAQNRVTGIVMNVKTGAIYAMATLPSFDLNEPYTMDAFSDAELTEYASSEDREEDAYKLAKKSFAKENPDLDAESEEFDSALRSYYRDKHDDFYTAAYDEKYRELLFTMWKNKAISELYEPGSTSKPLTAAMAFNESVTTPTDVYFCGGSYTVEGWPYPINCHELAGHGQVTFARGLQQSCNPVLMQVGEKIGKEAFYNYFKAFGYTGITGIDLPGESFGIYHQFKDFSNVSLAVYSFGQTYKTTPIQQITALASIANGGYIVTPHLLDQVCDGDGNVIMDVSANVKRQVVSTDACKTVSQILAEGVATDGGARNARVNGYRVCAKTGTSEKTDQRDASGETYLRVGSCVAYAPADDPEIAAIIVVDEPMGGSVYGSVVAAPYVSELLASVLPYLGFEAQYTDDSTEIETTTVVDYDEWDVSIAKSAVTNNGMTAIVVGGGDEVTGQIPAPASTMVKEGAKIVLLTNGVTDTNKVEVPDLSGRSVENARQILNELGLNIRVTGTVTGNESVVVAQTYPAGSEIPVGEIVEVTMRITEGSADD